jgi:hypothetical protein
MHEFRSKRGICRISPAWDTIVLQYAAFDKARPTDAAAFQSPSERRIADAHPPERLQALEVVPERLKTAAHPGCRLRLRLLVFPTFCACVGDRCERLQGVVRFGRGHGAGRISGKVYPHRAFDTGRALLR